MRSRGPLVLIALAVLAVIGLIAIMATDKRDLAFTLGVRPTQVATVLRPGSEACQRPIDVSSEADSVEFQVGTYRRPGEPLEVMVRNASGRIGSARVPGGYADNSRLRVRVGEIKEGDRIAACIRNLGRSRLALYGGPDQAARTSALFLEGKPQPADITLIFHRESRSMLSQLSDIFERAALFHPGWVGSWLFWVLAAAVALGVPLLLSLAMSTAEAAETSAGEVPDRRGRQEPTGV
jgi:hypothetical protein